MGSGAGAGVSSLGTGAGVKKSDSDRSLVMQEEAVGYSNFRITGSYWYINLPD